MTLCNIHKNLYAKNFKTCAKILSVESGKYVVKGESVAMKVSHEP